MTKKPNYVFDTDDELYHWGIPGQRWGVRNYQNPDGTWTEEGLRRRRKENFKELKKQGYEKQKDKIVGNLSEEYRKKFNQKADDLIIRDKTRFDANRRIEADWRNFNAITIADIEKIGIDKEVSSYLGDFANKKYSSIETFGEHIKNKEIERLRETIIEKRDNEQVDFVEKEYPKFEKTVKDASILEPSYGKIYQLRENQANDFFKNNTRISNATDLAMKAIGNEFGNKKPTKLEFLKNSLNYPDENRASGLVQIADLANRGFTKEQIFSIIESSSMLVDNFSVYKRNHPDIKDLSYSLSDISLYTAKSREKFIDKCVELSKANALSDAKQSRIKSLIASGKSQEEVARILGVSTSTVNKYK